jgi:hypothetical protein
MQRTIPHTAFASLVAFVVACGGSKGAEPSTPADEPAESENAASADEPTDSDESPEADESADADEADDKAEKKKEAEAESHAAKDVLTTEGTLFTFSFNASEAYQKAEKACDDKAKDDLKKRAECMSKAGEQFEADAMAFRKDDDGKWWWLTIQRRGKNIKTLHKIEFEFGEDTEDKVTIKPKGRDKGSKPMGRIPSEVVFEVPSRSEIAVQDPKFGRMVYQAKLGLLGESER